MAERVQKKMKRSDNELKLLDLQKIIGNELFSKVCNRYEGESIYFPSRGFPSKTERDTAILHEFYKGVEIPDLAKKYNLSVSQIYKITQNRG